MRTTSPLLDSTTRLRILARQLREVQEPERCAIVHDLHDEIGQILPVITLNLRELGRQPERPDAGSIEKQVSDSFQILHQVLQSTRSLTLDLKAQSA